MTGCTITRVDNETFSSFITLLCQLARYEDLPPPDMDARKRLHNDILGSNPKCEAYIGWFLKEPIGYVTFFLTYSTFLALPTLYLEDIFVLEQYRGRGFGTSLFDFCRNEADLRGCGRMDWMVLTWNMPSIQFYEKSGATRLGWYPYRLEGEALSRRSIR
ncbi:MAG: GNAT family N-acetyltransferase [Methanospirillaceae archaeon]|nr:GNAT family N-acetyltransferase [Methanospirillaceae archaeon]